ncbi:MAG: STAS domain-containing protein [Chloroflexi bacterium]|nr:STAS domain-containing protein [Chloroflexota bacterium]
MEIKIKSMDRAELVEISGRVDHSTAPELDQSLRELFDQGIYRVVLDLNGVHYISSAGLRSLLAARKELQRFNRGDLRLARVQPFVKETLDMVRFTPLFQIYDNVAEAAGSF